MDKAALSQINESVVFSMTALYAMRRSSGQSALSIRSDYRGLLPRLRDVMFADYFQCPNRVENVQAAAKRHCWRFPELTAQIHWALLPGSRQNTWAGRNLRSEKHYGGFYYATAHPAGQACKDAYAAHLGDPSCTNPFEPILVLPSMVVLYRYRIAHALHQLGVPLLPRINSQQLPIVGQVLIFIPMLTLASTFLSTTVRVLSSGRRP